MSSKTRTKIVVLNPFPVYPPISGGQGRVFHLYKHVAHSFDVVIICFADRRSYKMISAGLQQIMIPKSPPHCQMELEFFREIGFSTCAIIPKAANLTPEYAHIVKEQTKDASIIILSHPYLYKEAQKLGGTHIIVYDAHNVEYELHRQILPAGLSYLLEDIKQAEKAACEQSQFIAVCSHCDGRRLTCLYNVSSNKFIIIPNGADTETISFVSYEQRQLHKSVQNITQPWAVYMGSNFPPNLKAAGQVIEIAKQLPGVKFLLIGSLCEAFTDRKLPCNVELLGIITEQEKHHIFSLADVALNPVQSGSGTNLKMLEYMAAGLPVITTLLGARGISESDGHYFRICECEDMPACILDLLNNPSLATSIAQQAYILTKTRFDWKQIADHLVGKLSATIR